MSLGLEGDSQGTCSRLTQDPGVLLGRAGNQASLSVMACLFSQWHTLFPSWWSGPARSARPDVVCGFLRSEGCFSLLAWPFKWFLSAKLSWLLILPDKARHISCPAAFISWIRARNSAKQLFHYQYTYLHLEPPRAGAEISCAIMEMQLNGSIAEQAFELPLLTSTVSTQLFIWKLLLRAF